MSFAFSYTLRSLRRGGQRTVLAVLCVAFGVMALVAMQLLAATIGDAVLADPVEKRGGDASISRNAALLSAEDVSALDTLVTEGVLEGYTPVAPVSSLLLRPHHSGRVTFVNSVVGVDPATWPLVGDLRLTTQASLNDVLAEPGSALITHDLASGLGLDVGDSFTITGRPGSVPQSLRVSGIATLTPDRKAASVFVNLDTACMLGGGVRAVHVLWGEEEEAQARLEAAGWTVDHARISETDRQIHDLFSFMLKGAGLLGLLIGGIGVANTMQVLLARRTEEIATLKAMGYRQQHLVGLFGLETLLLGLAGGLLGAGFAVAVSGFFVHLLGASAAFTLRYQPEPGFLIGGGVTGAVLALLFGLYAMVNAAGVRPATLLRSLQPPPSRARRAGSFGLVLVILLLYGMLCSVIMASPLEGFGVVAGGLIGLAVLGALMGAVLLLSVRIPLPGLPLASMAKRNLRHQPIRAIFALVALFVGVFAIGFATVATFSARDTLLSRLGSTDGINLMVYASDEDAPQVEAALAAVAPLEQHVSRLVPVITRTDSGRVVPSLSTLEGRPAGDFEWNAVLVVGTLPGVRETLVPDTLRHAPYHLAPGSLLHVQSGADTLRLYVSGFYRSTLPNHPFAHARGALVSETVLERISEPPSRTYLAAISPSQLAAATPSVGRALPQAMVVSKGDFNAFMARAFQGLFYFVIAVASLAFVAGIVLIANAVGLAMVERRRELGLLKAIGYTSGAVLRTVLVEYGVLGLISGACGMAAVAVLVAVINRQLPQADLIVQPLHVLLLIGLVVGLAVGTAAIVAWHPTRVRPLAVLRAE